MSTYLYRSPQGKVIEREFSIGKAPRRVRVRGRPYDRIYSSPALVRTGDMSHIARHLPPWTPGARKYVTDKKSDDYGQPIVEGMRDVRNIESATDGQFCYDRPGKHANVPEPRRGKGGKSRIKVRDR